VCPRGDACHYSHNVSRLAAAAAAAATAGADLQAKLLSTDSSKFALRKSLAGHQQDSVLAVQTTQSQLASSIARLTRKLHCLETVQTSSCLGSHAAAAATACPCSCLRRTCTQRCEWSSSCQRHGKKGECYLRLCFSARGVLPAIVPQLFELQYLQHVHT
jgi:hypothetical protein